MTGHHYLNDDLDSIDILLTDNDDYWYFPSNIKPVIKLEYIEIYSDKIIIKYYNYYYYYKY